MIWMMGRRNRALIGFVLAVWLGITPSAWAELQDGNWFRYSTEHFQVYSKTREKEVAARIHDLEAFRATVLAFLNIKDRGNFGHVTKIFLLSNQKDIRRVFKVENASGFMRPGIRENLLVVGRVGAGSSRNTNHIAFHEYVHYLLRNASAHQYPTWWDEGIAELFATTSFKRGRALVGEAPAGASLTSQLYGDIPVRELLDVSGTGRLSRSNRHRFYVRSWLLVHYITLSSESRERKYMAATSRYLQRHNQGDLTPETFKELFGIEPEVLDSRLLRYASQRKPGLAIPLESIEFDPSYAREALSKDEIAYELAYQTMLQNTPYARLRFEEILRDDPDNARALAGLGVIHQVGKDYEKAEQLMRRAIALAEGDYLLHIELADMLRQRCGPNGVDCPAGVDVDEVDASYRRAYELNPEGLETQAKYGLSLLVANKPDAAVAFLSRAWRLSPSSSWIVVNLGRAYLAQSNFVEGKRLLNVALGWAADSPQAREQIQSLLDEAEDRERTIP